MPLALYHKRCSSFFRKNGVKHVAKVPYSLACNRLAERPVISLKEGLKKFQKGKLSTLYICIKSEEDSPPCNWQVTSRSDA